MDRPRRVDRGGRRCSRRPPHVPGPGARPAPQRPPRLRRAPHPRRRPARRDADHPPQRRAPARRARRGRRRRHRPRAVRGPVDRAPRHALPRHHDVRRRRRHAGAPPARPAGGLRSGPAAALDARLPRRADRRPAAARRTARRRVPPPRRSATAPARSPCATSTCTVPAGHTCALVGRTGSGKSTLASLLSRAVEPPRGTVLLGGTDVRDLDLQQLRAAVGVVTQRTEVLAGTLAENITLFADVPRSAVEAAVAELGLTDWVAGLPAGARHRPRPRRHQPVGRRGAARRVRPAAGPRRQRRRARRGHRPDGPGHGGPRRTRRRPPDLRPHRHPRRPPPLHDRARRAGGRARVGPRRAAGPARRASRRRTARSARCSTPRRTRRSSRSTTTTTPRSGPCAAAPRPRRRRRSPRAQPGPPGAPHHQHPAAVGPGGRGALPALLAHRRVRRGHRLDLGPHRHRPPGRRAPDLAGPGARRVAGGRAVPAVAGLPHLPPLVGRGTSAGPRRGAARADVAAPARAHPARRGRGPHHGRRPAGALHRPLGRLRQRADRRRAHRAHRRHLAGRRRPADRHGRLGAGLDAGPPGRRSVGRGRLDRAGTVRPVARLRAGVRPHRQARGGDPPGPRPPARAWTAAGSTPPCASTASRRSSTACRP